MEKLNENLIKKISKSTITIQRIPREKTTNLRDLIQSIPIKYLEPAKRNFHPQSFSNINDFSKPSPILESNAEINYNDIDLFSTALFPIDNEEPDVSNAKTIINKRNLEKNKCFPIFNINRETTAPINDFYEQKLEELSFIKLFPYGNNGYNEPRLAPFVKVTASAYAKSRVMSSDMRFQSIDYLFYILAKTETEKISATIAVCSNRLRNTENGRINNLHCYMKSLRGYSSYWNSVKSNLFAFLRNLGEPTWFVTLSARDLEWTDMIRTLMHAKNRNNSKRQMRNLINSATTQEISKMKYQERAKLLHDYPVVAARHFNKRFKALMKYLMKDDEILGGKLVDYWYRVEFQKRGSPHVHMLIWIKDAPQFNTEEGIKFIDKVVTCSIPQDPKLKELVERLQKHKCTKTCYSNNKNNKKCRFGYKLPISTTTRILNEDEIKKNNGKFCIFKRKENEQLINVYNLELLQMWNANMDIQPCGSLYGIAYYIAKYVAKEEPQHIQDELQRAIISIQNAPANQFAKQLHKTTKLIMKNRERSAQEAAYVLCGLRLITKSYINYK